MPASAEQLHNAISHDLGIAQWDGEDTNHWTWRCLYSAAGRTALHILWDDERPDDLGTKDAPPIDGEDAHALGSVSFSHFWKELDRILAPFCRLFPHARDTRSVQTGTWEVSDEGVWDEERKALFSPQNGFEKNWGMSAVASEASLQRERDKWNRWIFSIYLETGFIRHRPMRVGPAFDRVATLGDITFMRGSWLDATDARMSGLALWSPNLDNRQTIPFSDLLLLPTRHCKEDLKTGDRKVRQTLELLLNHRLEAIPFFRLENKEGCIVRFSVPFVLPPDERNLLLLCSWPKDDGSLAEMTDRCMAGPLFDGIRNAFEELGYHFKEVVPNSL